MTKLVASMRTDSLFISVLRVASGLRVKLAGCKSALTPHPNPQVVYSTDRSKAVYSTDRSKAVVLVLFEAL